MLIVKSEPRLTTLLNIFNFFNTFVSALRLFDQRVKNMCLIKLFYLRKKVLTLGPFRNWNDYFCSQKKVKNIF